MPVLMLGLGLGVGKEEREAGGVTGAYEGTVRELAGNAAKTGGNSDGIFCCIDDTCVVAVVEEAAAAAAQGEVEEGVGCV